MNPDGTPKVNNLFMVKPQTVPTAVANPSAIGPLGLGFGSPAPASGGVSAAPQPTYESVAGIQTSVQNGTQPLGLTVPSNIQGYGGSDSAFGPNPAGGNVQAPTQQSAPVGGVGIGAPAGYEYNGFGQLVPKQEAPAPDVTSRVGTQQNASALSQGNSYQDLLNAIANNNNSYQQTAQKNQDEVNAQNSYLQAVQNNQNFQLSLTGGELAQYGVGRPVGLDTGRAAQIAFNNQLQTANMQNAVTIAQTQLGYEQGSRQIRTTAAQTALQNELGIAGLVKPSVSGNALISPTGQIQNLGGVTDPAQITNLATAIFQNGAAPDFGTAYAQAQQILSSVGGQGGTQLSQAQHQSLQNNGSTVSTMSPTNILGYNLSSYATDPQYENKIMSSIGTMPQQMTTPSQIQSWIDKTYPNSPITGQMIFNASSSAGVSTKALSSILAVESQMASDGSTGAKMNNPGNYGNSDSAMANGQPTGFGSMQDGINHVAGWLAQHPAQSGQSSSANSNTDAVSQVKSYFPVNVQNGVRVNTTGIPYLDLGEVPSNLQQMAQTIAAQHGVKAFSPDDAKGIQALDTISNALNQVTMLAQNELNPANGGIGTLGNTIKNWWGGVTGTNPRLADFGLQKDQAIKAVTALAGGTGSGLRLNTGTIEAALTNFPTQNDSLETALEKIDKTRDLLAIQLGTAFGNPAIGNGIVQYNGHSYMPGDVVANANGSLGKIGSDGTITPIQNPYQ